MLHKTQELVMGRTMACLSLVSLMLLHVQITTCCTHEEDDERFETVAPAEAPVNINGVFFVKASPCYNEEGDDIYGADERRINTGANPLHNR
ncbi:hypothetical protein AgCh_010696 [Apium graveolens]